MTRVSTGRPAKSCGETEAPGPLTGKTPSSQSTPQTKNTSHKPTSTSRASRLFATEFGAKDADELNVLRAGRNYGWTVHVGRADDGRFMNPIAHWPPTSLASPSGITSKGKHAYVASLRGQVLWQVPLNGTRAGVPVAPDGSI